MNTNWMPPESHNLPSSPTKGNICISKWNIHHHFIVVVSPTFLSVGKKNFKFQTAVKIAFLSEMKKNSTVKLKVRMQKFVIREDATIN